MKVNSCTLTSIIIISMHGSNNIFTTDGLSTTEDGNLVTLENILIFCTGADREPPLGFSPKPTLTFTESELATASTCSLRLRLPFKHSSYEVFKNKVILSLKGNDGLGMA